MRTISNEPKVLMEIEESYALVIGFPTAETTFKAGQMCKLNNDGTVGHITASTQRPLGVIASAWTKTDKGNVRVFTPFVVIYSNAIADGIIDEGDLLANSGVDTAGLPKFKKGVTGDFISGVALKGGATTTSIQVGVLRVPSLVALPV